MVTMSFHGWEEPVRLLQESIGPPEPQLVEVAAALRVVSNDALTRLLLVARLEDAFSAKTGNQPPRSPSAAQRALLKGLGVSVNPETTREADALIRAGIASKRIDALRNLQPRRGDRLVRANSDRAWRVGEIVRVTSIDRLGAVWVKGAGGYPSLPQHLTRLVEDEE